MHVELNAIAEDDVVWDSLLPVELTGTAGMLIHRSVFDEVSRPWFEHRDLPDGTHEPSDTNFCRKLNEAGIPIYVDLETTLSHYNVVAVTPRYEDDHWLTSFAIGHEECFQVTHEQGVRA